MSLLSRSHIFCKLCSKIQNSTVQLNRTIIYLKRHRKPKSWQDPWNPYRGKGGLYHPDYIVPIFDEEILQSLPLEVRSRPVKAATINDPAMFYYNPVVQKFINMVSQGSKYNGRLITDRMLCEIKRIQVTKYWQTTDEAERAKIETNPVKIFEQAVDNAKPLIGTIKQLKLGTVHQIPIALFDNTKLFMALRWLKLEAREKDVKTKMHISLAKHVMQMYAGEGPVIEKRDELHRLAENNKSYIQLRRNAIM
ncbi:small ribosomal subunit protein uS7m-like isoform X1 [Convolutriloba macropyga]|uniref:small ribosomal subunit protein uS7m-like isoform X1 n=1 Tax=Convolutriloba macropyga TaxID=536237 RepID=UPI003F51C5EE